MKLSVRSAAGERRGGDALVGPAGVLSWSQLAERVLTEASALRRRLRLAPEDGPAGSPLPACLGAPVDFDTVIRLLALIELGVPFAPLHPRLTVRERVAQRSQLGRSVDLDGVTPTDASPALHAGGELPVVPDDERPLAFVFSSGTEGAPRGAVLSRRAFAAAADASEALLGWSDGDRWLLALSPARVGGLSILTRCLAGRRAIVVPESADPAAIADALVARRVTIASLVPTQLRRLLALRPPLVPPECLRAVLLGGAEAPAPLIVEARARGIPVLPTWGMTETCGQAATVPPGTPPDPGNGCGPPLPGLEIRIEGGRIAVRGPTLFSGYLGDRGAADRHPDPITPDGWFVSHDAGALDGRGYLFFRGRVDDVVVSGGEKIAPREVEQVLEESPGISAALVFGVPDPELGQVLAAALVASGDSEVDDGALAALLSVRLAPFKRPRRVAWIRRLPESPEGKPDRRAAAALLLPQLRPLSR